MILSIDSNKELDKSILDAVHYIIEYNNYVLFILFD